MSRWLIFTSFIAAAALVASAQDPAMPAIPEPQLALLPEDIRPQAKQAHDEALKNPKDASASGKLGMFLHAYHFDTEAVVCYRRAHLLDPCRSPKLQPRPKTGRFLVE